MLLHLCEVSNFTIIRFNCSISSEVKPEIVNPHLYLAYYNPKCQLGNIKKKSRVNSKKKKKKKVLWGSISNVRFVPSTFKCEWIVVFYVNKNIKKFLNT